MKPKIFLMGFAVAATFYTSSCLAQSARKPFYPLPVPIQAASSQFISTSDFSFRDASSDVWIAPKGTKTDGASIPQYCMSFIGPPMADSYRAAALVHDAYCAEANKGGRSYHKATWQEVHRMFYEACKAGGTPDAQAKLMYAAVWMFGPRNWTYVGPIHVGGAQDMEKVRMVKLGIIARQELELEELDISGIDEKVKRDQFAALSKYINTENPDIELLEDVMTVTTHDLKDKKRVVPIGQPQRLHFTKP